MEQGDLLAPNAFSICVVDGNLNAVVIEKVVIFELEDSTVLLPAAIRVQLWMSVREILCTEG
jgi:hypothetical protein